MPWRLVLSKVGCGWMIGLVMRMRHQSEEATDARRALISVSCYAAIASVHGCCLSGFG